MNAAAGACNVQARRSATVGVTRAARDAGSSTASWPRHHSSAPSGR